MLTGCGTESIPIGGTVNVNGQPISIPTEQPGAISTYYVMTYDLTGSINLFGPDQIDYTYCDSLTLTECTSQSIAIDVTNINNAPELIVQGVTYSPPGGGVSNTAQLIIGGPQGGRYSIPENAVNVNFNIQILDSDSSAVLIQQCSNAPRNPSTSNKGAFYCTIPVGWGSGLNVSLQLNTTSQLNTGTFNILYTPYQDENGNDLLTISVTDTGPVSGGTTTNLPLSLWIEPAHNPVAISITEVVRNAGTANETIVLPVGNLYIVDPSFNTISSRLNIYDPDSAPSISCYIAPDGSNRAYNLINMGIDSGDARPGTDYKYSLTYLLDGGAEEASTLSIRCFNDGTATPPIDYSTPDTQAINFMVLPPLLTSGYYAPRVEQIKITFNTNEIPCGTPGNLPLFTDGITPSDPDLLPTFDTSASDVLGKVSVCDGYTSILYVGLTCGSQLCDPTIHYHSIAGAYNGYTLGEPAFYFRNPNPSQQDITILPQYVRTTLNVANDLTIDAIMTLPIDSSSDQDGYDDPFEFKICYGANGGSTCPNDIDFPLYSIYISYY